VGAAVSSVRGQAPVALCIGRAVSNLASALRLWPYT
jgi:hypothetical protein